VVAAPLRSVTTERFRRAFAVLPDQVQRQARGAYRQFARDPAHPGLHFKPVHAAAAIYSARVGLGYRALGTREGDTVIWFWIGSHADYDRLLAAR
jgi:hypothetical protein